MTEIRPETIESCQQGSAAAFAEVVKRFERPLFAYVYRLGCTPPDRDTEDVVQEVFVKVYQNIHRFAGLKGCAFSTWLFSIAHNHCMSLGRRKQVEVETRRGDRPRAPRPSEVTTSGPPEILADHEEMSRIRSAAQRLPETLRSVFVLRYYQDLSCGEIGDIVGCNEGTVRSRLFRARQTILQTIEGADTGPRRNGYATS